MPTYWRKTVARPVVRDVVASGIAGVAAQAVNAALLAVLARALSVAELGQLLAFVGILLVIADLCDLGSSTAMLSAVAAAKDGMSVSASQLLAFKLFICGAAIGVAVATWAAGSRPLAAACLFAGAFTLNQTASAYLRGRGWFGRSGCVALLERGLLLTSLVIYLNGGQRLTLATYLLFAALSLSVAAIVAMAMWPGTARPRWPTLDCWLRGRYFALSGFATNIGQLYPAVISAVAGPPQVALFSAPSRLASPIQLIANSLASVALQRGARTAGRPSYRAALG